MSQYCIETQNLTKYFGNKTALNKFSLQIERGGIHAIIGSNGAGKTTLFKLLIGVDTPSSGATFLLGEDSQELTPDVRGKVGFVNEEHTLPGWMTAKQVTDFQHSYYPDWDQSVYESVVGFFDVSHRQKVSSLSRGERAGLNLAIALAQKPELLILDEPTLGLDVVSKQSFLEALMFSGTENGSTIIYCSHQMEEVERVADDLIIMEKGVLKNHSSPDEFVARVSYWITEFDQAPPNSEIIPGYLNMKKIDDQYHLWVIDQDDSFQQFLGGQGADSAVRCDISLDRAVNAFLSKNHAAAA